MNEDQEERLIRESLRKQLIEASTKTGAPREIAEQIADLSLHAVDGAMSSLLVVFNSIEDGAVQTNVRLASLDMLSTIVKGHAAQLREELNASGIAVRRTKVTGLKGVAN